MSKRKSYFIYIYIYFIFFYFFWRSADCHFMGQTVGAAGLAETTVSWETDAEHILLNKVFRQGLTHR